MPEPEHSTAQRPADYEHRGPQRHPHEEKRGPVADAILQTAQDLKEVGLGALGAYAYDQFKRPKDPPKDK